MVLFNYSTKELTAKVVYYGPGLCGKTTNLQWIHEKLPIRNKGKMVSLATEADRTLFFDFLPIELGTIRGMKTRIQLYTVPGQVFYNATRRMVLKGADCVVFVVDSQEAMIDANLDALANLRENLEANEIDPDQIPTVLQYNKRDLPNAASVATLEQRLNPKGWLHFEASAKQGIGVEETLKGVTGLVFRSLATKYGGVSEAKPVAPPPKPAQRPVFAPPPPLAPAPSPPRPRASPLGGSSADELLDSLGMPDAAPAADASSPLDELNLGPASGPELALDEPTPLGELDLEDSNTAPKLELMAASAATAEPPEIGLEELDSTPELSLDDLTPEPPMRARAAAPDPLDALSPMSEPEPPAAPPVFAAEEDPLAALSAQAAQMPPPAEVAPAAPAARPAATAQAVRVEVGAVPGQTEVTIPVEISLAGGTTRVTLNLRLTLDLKLPGRH
jgi:signal recognition particle receptor subunit beta